MASNFQETTIGNVCTVGDGAHAKVKRQSSGIQYLTSKNIGHGFLKLDSVDYISQEDFDKLFTNSSRSVSKLIPGDVLIGIIGTFGNAYRYKESDNFGISSSVAILRPNPKILDPDFLYYTVTSPSFKAVHSAYKGGSVQGYTNIPTIKALPITLPPLDEQKQIAHILGTLDDKIELNQQMNRTLEGIARALFKSWFIDFDPVRAKLDGRQPDRMDAETAALFPDAFEDGGAIGPIPKGWRFGNLEEIAEIVMGASPKGDTYNDEGIGIPLVNGPVEFGDYFVMKRKWTTAPTRLSQAGDLIFCVRGSTTGRRVIADDVFCLGRGVCAIRARLQQQPFINQLINTEIERLLAKTTGSVFPNLGSKDIKEFQIFIPSKNLIDRYCKTGFDLTNQIYAHARESVTLASLRDALLPKLLAGEIRVKAAEQALEAVA